eukprot:TRINITY_DN16197_c0_g1_i1.p2 TRINITY_DN16197_c0_g1~~TRINITY_DN16197_c0_g1_i1.p2  ORF type:complete len:170 (+),score=39.49 TRINITY_DN16197_c0_g1_i1:79-588(+)
MEALVGYRGPLDTNVIHHLHYTDSHSIIDLSRFNKMDEFSEYFVLDQTQSQQMSQRQWQEMCGEMDVVYKKWRGVCEEGEADRHAPSDITTKTGKKEKAMMLRKDLKWFGMRAKNYWFCSLLVDLRRNEEMHASAFEFFALMDLSTFQRFLKSHKRKIRRFAKGQKKGK